MFINMSLQESPCLLYISNDLRASDHFRLDSAQIYKCISKILFMAFTAPADCGWNRCIEWYWELWHLCTHWVNIQLFAISWTATCQAPLCPLSPGVCSNSHLLSLLFLTISYSAISFFCYVTPCNLTYHRLPIFPHHHHEDTKGMHILAFLWLEGSMSGPTCMHGLGIEIIRKKTGEKFWI